MDPVGATPQVTPVIGPSASSWLGEDAVARDEHAATVLGLRRAAIVGLVAWVAFAFVDWYVVTLVQPGRLWVYLAFRAVGLAVLGLSALRGHLRPIPSERLIRLLDVMVFTTLSAMVSAQCMEFGGIASPLSLGVVTILACRTAIVPDRWQRGLLPIGLTALVHPAVLLGMALVVPSMGAQLSDGRSLGLFGLNQLFVLGTAALTLVGSHKMWALRRKVYEARSLGRYRLIERIGRGGMGEVWIARHSTLRRDVAVKILRPDRMDASARERFEREVHATSELSHPNTVRVFDYGVTEDGLCYYAMELLAGEDLGKILRREGPLRPERVVRLVGQAARALSEAHGRGIVHRDLKPENLFITAAGPDRDLVKVLDFGLALVNEPEHESALTHTGWVVGTPAYIAPEVLSGHTADARADVYALGAVMYKLLTGVVPFAGPSQRAMLLARMQKDPPPPSAVLGTRLPEALESVVMTCLSRKPADRYASALDLAEALARSLREDAPRGEPEDDDLLEAPTRVFDRERRPYRRASPRPIAPVRAVPRAAVLPEPDTLAETIKAS